MPRQPRPRARRQGIVLATVADTADPQGLGRLHLALPDGETVWARVTGPGGTALTASIGDTVVVGFVDDDPAQPVVLGSLAPPRAATLRSAAGLAIGLDAPAGGLTVTAANGAAITIGAADDGIVIGDGAGNRLALGPDGVTIDAAARVQIRAGLVEIDAGLLRVSGVVQCATLLADSVIAASYSPGAGNVS